MDEVEAALVAVLADEGAADLHEPPAEALAQEHDVGLDAELLGVEERPGAPHPRLDLVEHQVEPVLVGQLARALREAGRAGVDPALPLDGLEEERGERRERALLELEPLAAHHRPGDRHAVPLDGPLERGLVPETDPRDLAERGLEAVPILGVVRQRERAERLAVVGALHRDEPRRVRGERGVEEGTRAVEGAVEVEGAGPKARLVEPVAQRRGASLVPEHGVLERGLDRLRARVREERRVVRAEVRLEPRAEARGQLRRAPADAGLCREGARLAEGHDERADDARVVVAEHRGAVAADEVEDLLALIVDQVVALRADVHAVESERREPLRGPRAAEPSVGGAHAVARQGHRSPASRWVAMCAASARSVG